MLRACEFLFQLLSNLLCKRIKTIREENDFGYPYKARLRGAKRVCSLLVRLGGNVIFY